jgi:hypothetical protein
MTEKWFSGVPQTKILPTMNASADWLAPKHNGPPQEYARFVREWCAGNGFTTEK